MQVTENLQHDKNTQAKRQFYLLSFSQNSQKKDDRFGGSLAFSFYNFDLFKSFPANDFVLFQCMQSLSYIFRPKFLRMARDERKWFSGIHRQRKDC